MVDNNDELNDIPSEEIEEFDEMINSDISTCYKTINDLINKVGLLPVYVSMSASVKVMERSAWFKELKDDPDSVEKLQEFISMIIKNTPSVEINVKTKETIFHGSEDDEQ